MSQTDRFGRLLRYIWLDDTTLVNDLLVAEGYAEVSTFPPDVRCVEQLREPQRLAREGRIGLWGACSVRLP